MKNNSIPTQLQQAETAINNTSKSAVLKAAMLPFGYTIAKLNEAKTLAGKARAAVEDSSSFYGDQRQRTAFVKTAFVEAKRAYQGLSKVARVIFAGQEGPLTTLGLNNAMPRRMDDFVLSAQVLFNWNGYSAEMKAALEASTYDGGKISEARGKIEELKTAREAQKDAMGDKQKAKKAQRKALNELHQWYMKFRKLARIALQDDPELLEKMDILHRSVKTKGQRGAAAKAAATRAKKKALKVAA